MVGDGRGVEPEPGRVVKKPKEPPEPGELNANTLPGQPDSSPRPHLQPQPGVHFLRPCLALHMGYS